MENLQMEKTRKIFAMGGGGFSMEPENPLLDTKALSLTKKENPNVCFLGTASGDSEEYIGRFYEAFKNYKCKTNHFAVYKPCTSDIEEFFLTQDLIYVGGGNTRNLLALWKEWELDSFIKRAYENGTVLAGISAGMICWFQQGLTDSSGIGLQPLNCLGILKGSSCPHFDGEANRRPSYIEAIKTKRLYPGYAADDGAALLFENEIFKSAHSSRAKALAYQVDSHGTIEHLATNLIGES